MGEQLRNKIAFFIFGISLNFEFCLILAAAHDMLTKKSKNKDSEDGYKCNDNSTGLVMFAMIIPDVLLRVFVPFFIEKITEKILLICLTGLTLTGLLMMGLNVNIVITIIGASLISAKNGMAEMGYLSVITKYDSSAVQWFVSGTGIAVIGSAYFSSLRQAGLSYSLTIFSSSFMCILHIFVHLFLLTKTGNKEIQDDVLKYETNPKKTANLTLSDKAALIPKVFGHSLPLFTLYFVKYLTATGLVEFLYFKNSVLTHPQQYRWFQVAFEVGAAIARSTFSLCYTEMAFLQVFFAWIILGTIYAEIVEPFIPWMFVGFILCFFQGFLGGNMYGLTFYKIHKYETENKDFLLALVSLASPTGIFASSILSLYIHHVLCSRISYFNK